MDERTIRAIHPWILSGRIVRDEGQTSFEEISFPNVRVVDREIRVAGRSLRTTWTYRIHPPDEFNYEIRGVDGSLSTFENTYREVPGGVRVSTAADISLRRVPRFLAGWIIRRFLTRADREDLAYLARGPKGT